MGMVSKNSLQMTLKTVIITLTKIEIKKAITVITWIAVLVTTSQR